MSVGKLGEFDIKTGTWSLYVDRLEMYFLVNRVTDELKLPTLIATMGDEAYELLVNLSSPKKPSELTFAEAKKIMADHLQPAPSALAERYRFRQRRQAADENIGAYVAELKRLARGCKFNDTLMENLRDQLVCGLRSEVIRQRLFAEDDELTFNNALKVATSLEAAERDAAAVELPGGGGGLCEGGAGTINAMLAAVPGRGNYRRGRGRGGGAGAAGSPRPEAQRFYKTCSACGADNHDFNSCPYREYTCSRCRRMGHLRRMCTQQKGAGRPKQRGAMYHGELEDQQGDENDQEGSGLDSYEEDPPIVMEDEETSDEEEFLHHVVWSDYKAVSLPICIDGHVVNMEIDTGTAISCVSKETYDKYFSHLKIEPINTILKFYDGSKIIPLGIVKPNVSYGGQTKQLDLFVIIGGGQTSLLGRQWLAELQIDLPKFKCNHINQSDTVLSKEIHVLLDRYKAIFSGGLGRYNGGRATLRVRPDAEAVFHRARAVPYALRDRIDAELDAMLRAGIIEPVDCSDWASPLVPVNKPDGSLRICADYKATLNPALIIDRYPLPRIGDVLVGLNGTQYFSKIDLSQAYNQIELDQSKDYTVINTHRGLFRYNRLVYGLASSPGIFQRIMCNVLSGIPNVQVFLDDVIIGGRTKQEHLLALEAVFQRLQKNGLQLKKSKCVFLVNEVKYLGYVVSKEGIKADPSKIEAISKMRRPEDVSELRSFLGFVNFFARFIRNFSALLVPLYNLLRQGVHWQWDQNCEEAFLRVKKIMMSTEVLAHYDVRKPLILTVDASARGVGGVLTQPGEGGERPVAFISRTLNDAEKHYSQIHREALAIVFCVMKFHQYLYGREFTLRTDHKPLVAIFGHNKGIPTMTASRMQRWAIILSAYNYKIEYVRTSANSADGLSRLPVNNNASQVRKMPEQTYLHFVQEALLLNYNDIKNHTSRDPILGRVLGYIRDGWPTDCEVRSLQPYFNRKTELYEELGCVMWGHRVVIPTTCRDQVIKTLHEPHMGIVKTKALGRSYVWWAGVDEDIEAACRQCAVCAAHGDAPVQGPIRSWPWPNRPWTRLNLDYLGPIYGKTYLVVVDATSKWLEIFNVPSTAASSTIGKLRELWSRFGIPRQIVTDNGPPFSGQDFGNFLKTNGIEHIFTAPYHPSSNGAAENAVKQFKKVIKKAVSEKKDVDQALCTYLLYYRNTEHTTTGEIPAVILLGRRLRTKLDLLKPDREATVRKAQQRQAAAAGGVQRDLKPGEDVWYRQYLKGEKWAPGQLVRKVGLADVTVVDTQGNQIHRHIDQVKRRSRSSLVCPNPPQSSGPGDAQPEQSEGQEDGDVFSTPERGMAPERRSLEGSSTKGSPASSPNMSPSVVPPQSQTKPVRQCRLNKVPKYKF